uniref:Reverse transcriptase zinc-binding domain-containing protein n=1 Tax=Amblyomma maculatum TaxID=34609 RepID=G3MNG6_AMBMU
MRRDNLFRPVSAGGLGLTHLYVRQLVARFFLFRNSSHPITRASLQTNLVNLHPNLVVSPNFTDRPSLFGFMKEVYDSVRFLAVRFSYENFSVSRKNLYQELISMLFPSPLYRSLYSNCMRHDVLKRVRKMPISPSTKTFFFKFHAEVLPVKVWLQKKNIFVCSVSCRLCDAPETIEHCFIACKDAILFYDVLQRTLKKDFILNSHNVRYLITTEHDHEPFDMIFLLGLHSLWKTRMLDRNAEPLVSPATYFGQMVHQLRDTYEDSDYLIGTINRIGCHC